jgi:2-polyprenyl-3-methyl-5-hydroxy-6-metoxy-1,4-benzoquinol methylase
VNPTATDWTRYYRHTPWYTSVTRAISRRKLIRVLNEHRPLRPLSVCEIGGANSCFAEVLCNELPVDHYHVVDLNAFGLSLLERKQVRTRLTFERSDILSSDPVYEQFDVVFSVGLIEHFEKPDTAKAIEAHFERCRAGGIVLITFPTPTFVYRATRRMAEVAGMWAFPDERPLPFEEVTSCCGQRGDIIHRSINWSILLTQGYVMVRARQE